MEISVIIPNYNGGRFLGPCLDSLFHQSRRAERVLVVDNGSGDSSAEVVRAHPVSAEWLSLPENRGFAGAAAAGLGVVDTEAVAFLNNDAVADRRWLEMGLRAMERYPAVSMFASLLLQHDSRELVDSAGDLYPRDGRPFCRGRGERASGYDKVVEVMSPSGGAAFYRRRMLEEVGGFEESFFSYLEDVDLGLRARRHGHVCLFIPEAVVYHVGAGTALSDRPGKKPEDSSRRVYWIARNRIRLIARNWPTSWILRWSPHLLAGILRSALYHFFLSGQSGYFFRGLWEGTRGIRADREVFRGSLRPGGGAAGTSAFAGDGFSDIARLMEQGAGEWMP